MRVACSVIALLALLAVPSSPPCPRRPAAGGIRRRKLLRVQLQSEHLQKDAREKRRPKNSRHAEEEGFTQAAGHPNFGITDFKINTIGTIPNEAPAGLPAGSSLTCEPTSRRGSAPTPRRSPSARSTNTAREAPRNRLLPRARLHTRKPKSASTGARLARPRTVSERRRPAARGQRLQPRAAERPRVGLRGGAQTPESAHRTHTELVRPTKAHPLEKGQYYAHTLIEGNVEWGAEANGTGKADYHDYFEINVSPALPLISSRLVFKGNIGERRLPHQPDACTGTRPADDHQADA